MDKPPKPPALLYAFSKIARPEEFTPENFNRWYDEVHIPDVFRMPGFEEGFRWEALDPNAERPYLATYPIKDFEWAKSGLEVTKDPKLPGSGDIYDLASFDTRGYTISQLYEPENAKTGQADFVISAAFTPADEEDYEKWYREEHLKDMARIAVWRKTERYNLLWSAENNLSPEKRTLPETPKFLTLHYFDGDSLPEQELAKAGESEWTKKNMSTMKATEINVFKKRAHFKK